MELNFTPDDEAFRASARDWLMANVPRERAPHDGKPARDYAQAWLARRGDRDGWAGIGWPKQYGGRGLSSEKIILWYEEYVRARAPSVLDCTFVALNHAGPTLIACGTEAQKTCHLPRILSGGEIWCQGFSEPGAGSDLASLSTAGRLDGDDLVVNGQKIWTSFADNADFQELLIRTDPGSQRRQGPLLDHLRHAKPGDYGSPDREHGGHPAFRRSFLRRRAHSAPERRGRGSCTMAGASR